MGVDITIERVENIPADSRVCHYDELGEDAKAALAHLTDSHEGTVDAADVLETTATTGFHDCELVKYTDYYEISVR
ncbi:hypothetical protein [Natrialba asiatica]|uniref:DUF7979 domain-containing protein n=1 Tax=Natrialba asiatica (strain ATCC 700177 / DSM 12278 / JCM 9576 / FERM P-10747 / NBRC 102637 / 172P1) TaxID=29540 RepID=M0AX80_NATA1|nr:hypothetical protein [Natrialba asiatica]ELZ01999.1 hypothetical protein C481_09048 [Natrialba asiatica DSM 12278]